MRDYSADRATTLGKVRPRHVFRLLEIVHTSTVREAAFIASRFADAATHFEETLAFLEDIGWLKSIDGRVLPANDAVARIVGSADAQRSIVLAEALFDASGPYERLFARYLSQFDRRDGDFVHHPTVEARLRETAARDFLMELGAVTHRIDDDLYVLAESFAPWALWARNIVGPTQNQLSLHAHDRQQLGRAAERAALDWERQRVGKRWENRVRHVSDENPTACFDIQSVTIDGSQTKPRFIEVKAVAAHSFEFHWSCAEIEAAEILHVQYFLYLLPVPAPGVFDFDQMEVIQNPYAEVYQNPTKWSTSVADIVCRKKESLAS